ncbi:MAG: YidC/Oxa1 family membrane protein insertase [Candidatus Moranbacteria bacterium]|nr:YidC/Oxa1 family membrane protein insertase [Candidatus Moranbacteria bacterium]
MSAIFHDIFYQPLYNILITLYNVLPGQDFGVAIIAFTLILRTLLIPIYKKQIESQKRLQELQPKIKEIQQKHKNDKEKQTKEVMEFYKKNKTNPFSGCLPLIIQLVFLIAIYRILITISNSAFAVEEKELYSFVNNPGAIKHFFLGIVDLTRPSIILAILAAAAQFYQTKMLMKKQPEKEKSDSSRPDFTQMMNKQMLYLGPLLTLFIGIKFAAGLALYWLVSTIFMIIQQVFISREEKKQS